MTKKRIVTPIVMIMGIVLCAVARLFMISRTDMKLGSISHDYEIVCNAVYYGVMAAAAVAAAIFARSPVSSPEIKQEENGEEDAPKIIPKLIISGKGAVAVGFGLLAVGLGAGYDAVLTENNGLVFTIFKIAGLAFAVMFIICAFTALYKKEINPGLGFACSFGGVYFVMRGVFCFMNRMVVAAIPEYLIEVLCSVLGAVFFVMVGQVFTGNEGKLTRKALCAWGVGASALSLSALIGTAAAKLFLGSEISERIVLTSVEADRYFQSVQGVDGYKLAFPAFANIGLGIFAVIVVLVVSLAPKEQLPEAAVPEEQNSEQDPEGSE